MPENLNKAIESLESFAKAQEEKMYRLAREIVPHVTPDDLMQPFDFPELESHGAFRYEEGALEGIRSSITALRYIQKHPEE